MPTSKENEARGGAGRGRVRKGLKGGAGRGVYAI